MIDRGWKIPKPVPDSQGRLFAFGGGGGSGGSGGSRLEHLGRLGRPGIEGPPGKDLLSSEDLAQCAAKAQKATGQTG